ncbi:MAG: carbohydrate kinase family protein [bacterium]|nr:carbohydrate kinase family protein [bacterium]
MFSKHIDFLAIGDITTDAFIKLKEAHITNCVSHENREICLSFADKIPYESVTVLRAVGNSANAAVAAARLGLSAALSADIGADENGRECLKSLHRDSVNTKFIYTHKGMETNYHYVLWYDAERTILVKHQDFPRVFTAPSKNPKWVYISSLGGNSYEYHLAIVAWLEKNPSIKVAFQPGTFQINLGIQKLANLYKRSDIFFCNREEARKILATDENDIKELLKMIHNIGPKTVFITDGPKGAYVYDGTDIYFMAPYPDPKPPFERTGAGDAFASTITSAFALGKTLDEALLWAMVNSASVVQDIGAQRGLLTQTQIEEWLTKAPADYKPRKI